MPTASDVVVVHFVLASVAREEKRSVVLGVGLGSECGRNGLEWVVFSLVFIINQLICHCFSFKLKCLVPAPSDVAVMHFVLASVAREEKRNVVLGVGLGSECGRNGLEWVRFSLLFIINQWIWYCSSFKLECIVICCVESG